MKLVVLDRDGVINRDSDQFIKSLEEWIPIPGSIEAIASLSRNDFTVAVATNQSGLARGLLTLDSLRDLEAGVAVGCRPILVRTGKGERTMQDPRIPKQTVIHRDLAAAADWLLGEQGV